MQIVDTARWNLASVALAAAACGPQVVDAGGEAASDSVIGSSSGTSGSTTGTPDPGSDTGVPCPDRPCDPGYSCAFDYCVPDCNDGNCCLDGCCYGDTYCGGETVGYDCSDDADCNPGEYCYQPIGCQDAALIPACAEGWAPAAAQSIPVVDAVLSLAFIDGNGDAARELVVGHASGATLLPGGGGDPIELELPPGTRVDDLGVGDIDGDGRDDLALLTSDASAGLHLLYGTGSNGFAVGVEPQLDALQVELADVSGDGLADLVLEADVGGVDPQVELLVGHGDGTFEVPVLHSPTGAVVDFAVGQLVNPQWRDLVVMGAIETSVFFGGEIDGTADAMPWDDTSLHVAVGLGDFDGDGRGEIVRLEANQAIALVDIRMGSIGADYYPSLPVLAVPGGFDDFAVGDVDGNGRADIVATSPTGEVAVLANTGAALRDPTLCASGTAVGGAGAPVLGDYDGDGRLEVARADGAAVQLFVIP